MKPGMMWGFSTFKDMRQTFTADMANARLKRSSGVEGPEDDDVDLADELSGKVDKYTSLIIGGFRGKRLSPPPQKKTLPKQGLFSTLAELGKSIWST